MQSRRCTDSRFLVKLTVCGDHIQEAYLHNEYSIEIDKAVNTKKTFEKWHWESIIGKCLTREIIPSKMSKFKYCLLSPKIELQNK